MTDSKQSEPMEDGLDLLPDLARRLRADRLPLARALNPTAMRVPRFAAELRAADDDGTGFALREHTSLIDYMANWIEWGDPVFRALYLGERAKMAYDPGYDAATRATTIRALVESDAALLGAALRDRPDAMPTPDLHALSDRFARMAARLDAGTDTKELRVLMVGDCLHLDVTGFLVDRAAGAGIAVRPTYLTDKNPAGMVARIASLAREEFDAVFFSPFTYEHGLVAGQVLAALTPLVSRAERDARAEAMLTEAGQVAEALARTFAAPVFVHNTALLRRHTGRVRDGVRRILTAGPRAQLRARIDGGIDALVARLNAETFPHVHKLDELAFLDRIPEAELGRYLHRHGLQHPARLGALVAERYTLILETIAHLSKKKLVVCDLDNTLWDGVIGEGAVAHFTDRQKILLRLKAKGVLLAIASKNDPANVTWEGGALSEGDFVASEISWAPKVTAFPTIEAALNLKRKDFVFIDDRADERGLVTESYPEIRALDAEDPRVWEMMDLWERLLGEGSEMDRTQMYLDRAKRQAFEAEAAGCGAEAVAPDKGALFGKLGLELTIREAGPRDLKRAAELVNRTNQFNMTARRTAFAEMRGWAASPDHRVRIASMRDRFGEMGVIAVLVADLSGGMAEIPVFVLSCRVFGYDAEAVLLGQVKRDAAAAGLAGVTGRHVPTMVNAPCRETYAEAGFARVEGGNADGDAGEIWDWRVGGPETAVPDWLRVVAE